MKQISIEDALKILNTVMDYNITNDQLDENLCDLGMDSITFIRIIVALEEEFECEIPDYKLLISEMDTVNKIYEVLTSIERGDST